MYRWDKRRIGTPFILITFVIISISQVVTQMTSLVPAMCCLPPLIYHLYLNCALSHAMLEINVPLTGVSV